MATTIYPIADGIVYKFVTDTWANTRNATSGTLNTSASYYIQNSHTSGRGGDTYQIGRYFLEFDTSSINKTLSSATLSLYGYSLGTLDVILMKSTQHNPVATSDYNNIYAVSIALAASDGHGGGTFVGSNGIFYSDEVTTWSTSTYNNIGLNNDAKADIIANDTFRCVLIGFDYDGRDVATSEAFYRSGFRQDSYSGTSSDPKLVVTEQDNSVFAGANF